LRLLRCRRFARRGLLREAIRRGRRRRGAESGLLVRVEEKADARADVTAADVIGVDVIVVGGIVADAIGIVVEIAVEIVVWIVERLGMLSRADATLGWMRCARGLLRVELVRRRVTMSLWI
jgi:hypothetical protein